MAKILLVSQTKSFILSSLVTQLEEHGHKILWTGNDPSEIGKVVDEVQVLLLYAEDAEMEGLVYLKDRAIEETLPVFVIGDLNVLKEVTSVIPEQFIKKQFLRPVNVKEVVEVVDKYLKEESLFTKKKILVVDDSGAMLRSIKDWLQDKYQVILANSGAAAIKYLALNHPDLILLDYEMPVCDGKQVLEMIRAESEFSNVPVIFLTGKNDKESVMSVSALKPEGYLLKTMEPKYIVQAIDEFFEKSKAMI